MTDESTRPQDPTAAAAAIGASAAKGSFDTAQWQQGGYEAESWDSGPDYVPTRPNPAPRRRTLVAGVLVTAMVVLVAVAAIGLSRTFSRQTTAMSIGNCITASRDGVTWITAQADCDDTKRVTYTVVSHVEGQATCPDPYTPLQYPDEQGGVRRTYCLMENLTRGACYAPADGDQIQLVGCDDQSAKVKVVQRVDGIADASCGQGETPVMFGNSPQRTYCFADPSAG